MSNQIQFWTQPTGSLFFFFRFIVAHNHVVVAAVVHLNKSTARIADLTSVDAKRQYDAGLIGIAQKPDAIIRYYNGRQDLLIRKGFSPYTRAYATTDFEVIIHPYYGVQWYKFCCCNFCRNLDVGAKSIHCHFGTTSTAMEISTKCDIVRSALLPENIPTVFGQDDGAYVDDVFVSRVHTSRMSSSSFHASFLVILTHGEISTPNQRRYLYKRMLDAIISHVGE